MFKALVVGVFFALLIWVRYRARAAAINARRLSTELAETQHQLEKAEHQSQQLIGLLTGLQDYKVSPTAHVAWQELADFTVKSISAFLGAEAGVLLRWDPNASEYRGLAVRGLSPQQVADLHVRQGEGIVGQAAQNGKMVVTNEALSPDRRASKEGFLTAPYLILPLWVHSHVEGILILCRPQEGRFGPDAQRLAALMAKHIQLTMENLSLYENRQRIFGQIAEALATALNAKDPAGQEHMERCRTLVRSMAHEMHLPELLIEQIELGAVLHDIGKVGIKGDVLLKPEPLTGEDYAAVKKHPEIGFRILRGINFFQGIAPIVLYHHEWMNGQGYPEGLVGEEIPIGARMVAIADAWDAMTTDQPYRKALAKNHAIAELRQQAGTQFDPRLVNIFLHVIDKLERTPHSVSEGSEPPAADRDAAHVSSQNA